MRARSSGSSDEVLDRPAGPSTAQVALSHARDPEAALAELAAQIDPAQTSFVLLFMPDVPEPAAISAAVRRSLGGLAVFGCSTMGQITPRGYEDRAWLAIAFPRRHFRCASMLVSPLARLSIEDTARGARRLNARFGRMPGWNRLALVIADGLSKQEDLLVAALEAGLDDLPVFGGSASDALRFQSTFVLHEGRIVSDAAILLLIETDLAVQGVGFDHFEPTDKMMVVTASDPAERLVLELNGAPAAREYARLVGCRVEDLSPTVFAENPVLVRNRTTWHVRAIQKVEREVGLSLFSAIDDGLVLTLGRGRGMLAALERGLPPARPGAASQPDFILGFDCFLRKLEFESKGLTAGVSRILAERRVLGFSTYGEQHRGVHVNQTFVGVAFFPPGLDGRP